MKTKIYAGRDLIGRFTCDGKRYTRFQLWLYQAKQVTKRSIIALAVICLVMWGFVAGSRFVPSKTVFAEKEVIKEIGIKFEDIPMLVKICKAESGGKQFKPNGDVLRGIVNPSDIGFCQINEYINNDEARRLGYDIYTEKGNKDYAVYLFLTRGTEPWNSSREVWCKGCRQLK
jgi:hypothetical protein